MIFFKCLIDAAFSGKGCVEGVYVYFCAISKWVIWNSECQVGLTKICYMFVVCY